MAPDPFSFITQKLLVALKRVALQVLDSLMGHMVVQCKDLCQKGLEIPNFGTVRLVPITLEGDLPAQAKLFHCKRNFNCQPNKLCTWCDAQDGGQYPYTDFSATASWKTTIPMERPWTNWSPMTGVPGAQDETFLSKDVFHLCHLVFDREYSLLHGGPRTFQCAECAFAAPVPCASRMCFLLFLL